MKTWMNLMALLLPLLFVATSCSGEATGPIVGSESHFLSACEVTSECAEGLTCSCGICTTGCVEDDTCSALGAARCGPLAELSATCSDSGAWPESICVADCTDNAQCQAIDATMTCTSGGWCQPQGWGFDEDANVEVDASTDADLPDACTASPFCESGFAQVSSHAECPQDAVFCYEDSLCGTTIWCWAPLIPSAPIPQASDMFEPRLWPADPISAIPLESNQGCLMEITPGDNGFESWNLEWSYDEQGRLIEHVTPSETLTLIYNGEYLGERLRQNRNESPEVNTVVEYHYDETGRRESETTSVDDVRRSYRTFAYDINSRLVGITEHDATDDSITREMTYTYNDRARTIRAETAPAFDSEVVSKLVQFDDQGRVDWYNFDGGAIFGSVNHFSLDYDGAGKVVRKEYHKNLDAEPESVIVFSYDEAGKLLELTSNFKSAPATDPLHLSSRIVLSYDGEGRLTEAESDINVTGTNDQHIRFTGRNCRLDREDLESWGRTSHSWGAMYRVEP